VPFLSPRVQIPLVRMRKQPEIRLRRQQALDALLMNCLWFQGLGRPENETRVYQLLAILTKGFCCRTSFLL
jgi:hypothetical protein